MRDGDGLKSHGSWWISYNISTTIIFVVMTKSKLL